MPDEVSHRLFHVNFHGETISADSTAGTKGHILMIHGGSKDRTCNDEA